MGGGSLVIVKKREKEKKETVLGMEDCRYLETLLGMEDCRYLKTFSLLVLYSLGSCTGQRLYNLYTITADQSVGYYQ